MKEFFRDYKDLCKHSIRFYKTHWKGVVVVNAVFIAAELAYFHYQTKKFEREFSKAVIMGGRGSGMSLFSFYFWPTGVARFTGPIMRRNG